MAATTRTCEVCGEDLLLEDMRTHFLLQHLEHHISRTTGGAKDVGDAQSSAGKAAPVLTTRNTEASRDFGRKRSEDDEEEPASSPRDKLGKLACPMCSLVCSSYSTLQEHVELHLQEELQVDEPSWACPVCWLVLSDGLSLQEHVEQHLEPDAAASSSGGPGLDLELARQLQEEENQRRRREETEQEKEEFKKLQRQFGVDGSGGYRRQMERAMERAVSKGLLSPVDFHCRKADMMEALASGLDEGATRTSSVLRMLSDYYQAENADCARVWLSADTDHFGSSAGDRGWGCGYRNVQMLLSALHRIETYASVLPEKTVPSIPQLQRMIEGAWKEGLDPQGASHFDQRLLGSPAWIGATEVFSLLTFLGINSRILDFHRATGPGDTHPLLFDWVRQYFSQAGGTSELPARLTSTSLPPLYLQHHGHSRTIVGLEQKRNGKECLLLLDPASSVWDSQRSRSRSPASAAVRSLRRFPGSLKHQQYQLVVTQGVLAAPERQLKIMNSKTLCAEKIP